MFLGLFGKMQGLWLGVTRRMRNEKGAVATEYALLLVLVAIAIIAAATALGFAIAGRFSDACNSLNGATCP
jgi:Flp pilus assembly pilin Flp